jgi:hypothetical protein
VRSGGAGRRAGCSGVAAEVEDFQGVGQFEDFPGNSVSPQDRSRRVMPANWPVLSWARVCMNGAVTRQEGLKALMIPARTGLRAELSQLVQAAGGAGQVDGLSRQVLARGRGRSGSGACPGRTARPPD